MGQFIDLSGKRVGKLTVLERVEDHIQKSGAPKAMWRCRCDCGNERIVYGQVLRSGKIIDCGCGSFERRSAISTAIATTHGGSDTRLYRVWRAMRERCNSRTSKNFKDYGARGIKVFGEWEIFENFRDWAFSHGYDQYAKRGITTLDRINVNGNYEPENCRFVEQATQCRNKRNNWNIEFNGKTQCLTDWAKETGIKRLTLRHRLKSGWSVEDALTVPVSHAEALRMGQGEKKKVWRVIE